MPKMTTLRQKVLEIIAITQECPEHLQPICFQVLLQHVVARHPSERRGTGSDEKRDVLADEGSGRPETTMDAAASTQHDLLKTDLHVKVSRFLEKHGLDVEHLNQLFYKEDDRILPLYEDLKTTRVSESQVRITLLQCLLNAITTGEFQTTVENARVEASTRKCYDKNNWGNNYTNNAGLFDFDKYARTVKTISLSEAGRKALADVIKELQ
jgi:hypothetical protein